MNHLNVFHAFKDKAAHHEDELIRSFLVLVENIPSVQSMFLNMILEAKSLLNTLSVDASKSAVEHVYKNNKVLLDKRCTLVFLELKSMEH